MKENEFPILKISDVEWDEDHEDLEKLPKNFDYLLYMSYVLFYLLIHH